jgi:Fe-S cluster biogenesis protein NfuA
MMTDEEIKISAQVLDAGRCQFSVDRPVLRSGGPVQFSDPQSASRHPLAEMIFGMEGITGVMLLANAVIVAKEGNGEWRDVGKQVGKAIRAHLKSAAYLAPPPALERSASEMQIGEKVQHLLDTQINPQVATHGGKITLIEVKGTTVSLQMGGGCQGCSSASATLKQGVERSIREAIPEITEIIDVTDHAAGHTPYYPLAR